MNVIQTPVLAGRRVLDPHVGCRRSTAGGRPRSRPSRPPCMTTASTPAGGRDAAGTTWSVGIRRRKTQMAAYQTDSRNSSVPSADHDVPARGGRRWSPGRSAGRRRARCPGPCTTVALPVLGSDSHDARPGIGIPPLTVPFGVELAEQPSPGRRNWWSGHQLDRGELHRLVRCTPSGPARRRPPSGPGSRSRRR